MKREGVSPLSRTTSEDDIQKKYDHAMKILGEKEFEVTMLREMLKKVSGLSERIEFSHKWILAGFPATRVPAIASVKRNTYYYRLSHPSVKRMCTGGRPIPGYSRTKKGKKLKIKK
ncbi:hypothetical protein V6B33_14495 [Mangrovibacillus sp. Mu-81]|jgi:hypothetical protein|uniref:hypothetical protein n=1 Tax=Mangrovibacillus sp. Mu-81 TaxID=3121478 RepID=UPI002FE45EA1